MADPRIDYDGDAKLLVENAYQSAQNVQYARHEQCKRDWLLYLAYLDMSERDEDMPNIALPKMFSILETKAPADTQALFGRRPIIPFEARRKEFKEVAEVQSEVLDELLQKAGIYEEGSLLTKIKMLYGTGYMNVLPWYETVTEKVLQMTSMGAQVQETQAHRLRLKVETWAPWEVLVDPHAQSLMTPDGCRYVIKIQMASKRMIKKMYEMGAYPEFDLEKLDNQTATTQYKEEHMGMQMLADYGIPIPENDDDMGIILRYESPDRYVDSWMGVEPLRDIPNKFKHQRINLSKMTHVLPPHTQHRFYGIGEAKPNEIQIAMLNDLWNLTFASHGMVNQPAVFYRKGRVEYDDIVFGVGRRIPIDSNSDRPIADDIMLHGGQGLPRDHYALPESVERNIDLASGQFAPGRGEMKASANTATEVAVTTEQGNVRQEASIKLGERTFLADFGKKAMSIIDQFSTMSDVAEIVGIERAMITITANPSDLPGGFNFTFKGSERVNQLAIKQQSMINLAPILQQSPTARPGGLERKLLDLHDFDDNEIADIQLTEEEIMQAMQAQAQMAMTAAASQQESEQEQEGYSRDEKDKDRADKKEESKQKQNDKKKVTK